MRSRIVCGDEPQWRGHLEVKDVELDHEQNTPRSTSYLVTDDVLVFNC